MSKPTWYTQAIKRIKEHCKDFFKVCLGVIIGILFCTSQRILKHDTFNHCVEEITPIVLTHSK